MIKKTGRSGAGRPSAEEAERKKIGLITAARAEFAAHGFNGSSLRAIAEKAGVSTRTLFNHYPDKTALFAACIDHSSQYISEIVALRRTTLDETLIAYAMAMQDQLSKQENRQLAMLIYREGAEFEAVRNIARLQFETYQVKPVVQILRDFGYESADLHEMATQFVVMALSKWQHQMLFGGPAQTNAETLAHIKTVARIFLFGIGMLNRSL